MNYVNWNNCILKSEHLVGGSVGALWPCPYLIVIPHLRCCSWTYLKCAPWDPVVHHWFYVLTLHGASVDAAPVGWVRLLLFLPWSIEDRLKTNLFYMLLVDQGAVLLGCIWLLSWGGAPSVTHVITVVANFTLCYYCVISIYCVVVCRTRRPWFVFLILALLPENVLFP